MYSNKQRKASRRYQQNKVTGRSMYSGFNFGTQSNRRGSAQREYHPTPGVSLRHAQAAMLAALALSGGRK